VDEHLERMLKHLYVEIDATDEQKPKARADREAGGERPAAAAREDAATRAEKRSGC